MSDFIKRLDEERRNTEAKLELPLRSPLCIQIEQLLIAIVDDQDTGKSQFFIDCEREFGYSLAYALATGADNQRKRIDYMNKMKKEKDK